jgi:hypothetical protein
MLRLEGMECVLQGEFSHVGSINTTKNRLVVVVEHAMVCNNIVFRMSAGSTSGKDRHEQVHR